LLHSVAYAPLCFAIDAFDAADGDITLRFSCHVIMLSSRAMLLPLFHTLAITFIDALMMPRLFHAAAYYAIIFHAYAPPLLFRYYDGLMLRFSSRHMAAIRCCCCR